MSTSPSIKLTYNGKTRVYLYVYDSTLANTLMGQRIKVSIDRPTNMVHIELVDRTESGGVIVRRPTTSRISNSEGLSLIKATASINSTSYKRRLARHKTEVVLEATDFGIWSGKLPQEFFKQRRTADVRTAGVTPATRGETDRTHADLIHTTMKNLSDMILVGQGRGLTTRLIKNHASGRYTARITRSIAEEL